MSSFFFSDRNGDFYRSEKARCNESNRQREQNIQDCQYEPSDACLSMAANNVMADVYDLLAGLAENDGFHSFLALADLDGNMVNAKRIQGKYGLCWMILGADGQATGEFVPYQPKKAATLAKKGYQEVPVEKPACVTIVAGGAGLAGALSARAVVIEDFRSEKAGQVRRIEQPAADENGPYEIRYMIAMPAGEGFDGSQDTWLNWEGSKPAQWDTLAEAKEGAEVILADLRKDHNGYGSWVEYLFIQSTVTKDCTWVFKQERA